MAESLDKLNAKVLSEHLHTKFRVRLDETRTLDLEIADITEHHSLPRLEQFFLALRGPHSPRLAQRIHRLEHDKLGAFDIFLTPIAGDDHSTTYEAVFNRIRKQAL